MKLFGKELTRNEIRQRVGDITQIAGITSYTLNDGRSRGVQALDVKTGSGFKYTVLPGRAMDIAWMEQAGRPVGFISKTGITHSQYYQPYGYEWLRSFYGGVLTTCGLTHVGPPEKGEDWDLGLHGRISNTPAEEVTHRTYWEKDNLVLKLEGKMREASMFHENLVLHRTITSFGGENKLVIEDKIENQGYEDTPLMLLYHMNLGFPLISEESRLSAPILHTLPRDGEAQKGIENFDQFEAPTSGYKEQVFFHTIARDKEDNTCAGIINEPMNLGFYIRYNYNQLPFLTQWKMMGRQDYVVGLEPGNCIPIGCKAARDKGDLVILKPGAIKKVKIEIGLLNTWEEIQWYKDYVNKLIKNSKK